MKNQTAILRKSGDNYQLDTKFKTWLSSKKDGDITLKVITDAEYRSNQQNRLYWSVWLSVIVYYMPDNIIDPCPVNSQEMHDFLLFGYGIKKGAIKTIKYKGLDIPLRPSWSFDKMSKKDATEYLDFVQNWVDRNIGSSIEKLIDMKNQEA